MIGKVLNGRYKIIKLIGSGGMADVYLAYCNQLDRKVAVKLLKSSDDELAKEVFMRESKAIARLSHPNIVQVYDFFEEDNKQCIVMEYIQGVSLKNILRTGEREFTERQVLEMGYKLSKALSHAHSNGVIHSDIKPDNIIVDEYLEPRITDFGIAKLISDGSSGTKQMYGSVRYSSPEQVQGKIIDERSDIYSLGVVLYELINKRLPYPSITEEVIDFKMSSLPIVNPKNINRNITPGFNDILVRCLSSDKKDRYGSMRHVTTEIGNILNNYGERKTVEKRKKLFIFAGVAIVSIIALISLLFMLFGNSDVMVPNIELMNYVDASKKLEDEELRLNIIERRNSSTINKDIIISQDKKGERVKKGTTINVVVSSGKEDVLIPDLANMTKSDAKQKLKELGIELGEIKEVEKEDVEADIVLSQTPESGTKVDENTVVNLVVSKKIEKEEEIILMPDLSGSYLEEAIGKLNVLGLYVYSLEFKRSDKYLRDQVISTSIEVDERVKPGDKVKLIVSIGNGIKDGDSMDKTVSVNLSSYVQEQVRVRIDYIYKKEVKTVYDVDVDPSKGIIEVKFSAPKGAIYTVFIDQEKIDQGLVE